MKIRSLRMLKHFLRACQTRNFHKAAKAEAITQTALTKSIQQLERTLGVTLFERSRRGVALTRFGEALLVRAKRVEAECKLIEREIEEMLTRRDGELTIAAGSIWSSLLLPRIIAELRQSWPNSSFTIVRSSGSQFPGLFARDEIDVGLGALDSIIGTEETLAKEFAYEPISEIETSFFAHGSHPLHGPAAISADQLRIYPWAVFRFDPELNKRIGAYFALKGLDQPHTFLTSDSVSGVMEALRNTQMITCLPAPLASIAKLFGVAPLPVDHSPWKFQTGIMYRSANVGYPLFDDFVARLRRDAKHSPAPAPQQRNSPVPAA